MQKLDKSSVMEPTYVEGSKFYIKVDGDMATIGVKTPDNMADSFQVPVKVIKEWGNICKQ